MFAVYTLSDPIITTRKFLLLTLSKFIIFSFGNVYSAFCYVLRCIILVFLKVLVFKILAKFWSTGLQLITLGTPKPFESNFWGLLKHERETMNWSWCDNINLAHQTNAMSLIINFQKSLFAWAPVFAALLQCFLL